MYRRIVEAVPEGIWVVSAEGQTIFSNQRMAEILGVDFETMPQRSCFECVYPDELADAQRHFARTLGGDRRPFEFRLRRGDGSPIWVSISCMLVKDEDGAPAGLLGLFADISERKQAEASLRESEERFRLLADAVPVMVWVAGPDKGCTYFNKQWLDFTGRPLTEELGHGWADSVHPEDKERCLVDYSAAFDARSDFRLEYRLRRADGEYRTILDNGTPFYREGAFAGYIGSCIDVTEQRQIAERAREEAERRKSDERQAFLLRLSDALRPLADPIAVQATATRLVGEYLSLDRCGYGEADESGRRFLLKSGYLRPGMNCTGGALRLDEDGIGLTQRLLAGKITAVPDVLADSFTGGLEMVEKFRAMNVRAFVAIPVLKDGELRAVFRGHSATVRHWTRQDRELMADVADRIFVALERVRAEAELRQSEERMRVAAQAAKFGTFDVDLVANTMYWSQELREIAGLRTDEPLPPPGVLPDFVHPEDRLRVEAVISSALDPAGPGIVMDEHRIVWPDGSVRWVQIRGQVAFEGKGQERRPVRHAGVLLDITERKRDEERLRQTQKLESVGLLAGGIAHDFNNLLTGIMGHASLALDEVPAAPAEKIREVISSAERAAHLTRQLLAYSGKGQFILGDIDVSQTVQEIADLVQFSIPKSVQLSVNLEKRLPVVRMDPGQLQQILMNLVINAAEAIGEGVPGRITVSILMRDIEREFTDARGEQVDAGRYVCVQITDTGPGISEQHRKKIFEPFFTTKFTGRGLGLAAVAGILRSQRGGITVQTIPGTGSSFRVFLRATEAAARAGAPLTEPDTRDTVLVVDDERHVREFIGAALRKNGYRVLLASDGREALAICQSRERSIDAMVLDTVMPLMGLTNCCRS
jgi:PAS domain S-box-containing protein